MATIKDIQEQIVEEFAVFDNWMDKYQYIIDLGKALPVIEESAKTEENLIKGCQSRVWLSCKEKDGLLYFTADSDAIITKGIISLLIRVYDGHSADEILAAEPEFIEQIGLKANLSPTRANGLLSMIKQIKLYALAYSQKESGAQNKEQEVATEAKLYLADELQKNIVRALKQVYDPEISVNVYDLGLIYEIKITPPAGEAAGFEVFIKMTMTSPTCPLADDVIADVESAVSDVPGVKGVKIELVFEPAWDDSRMSEEAKLELGLL